MIDRILHFFGAFKLIFGLSFLLLGCCFDGDGFWYFTRLFCSIFGAYVLIGNCKNPIGYLVFFIGGLGLHLFVMQSGVIQLLNFTYETKEYIVNLPNMAKIPLRLSSVMMFVMGYRHVKQG